MKTAIFQRRRLSVGEIQLAQSVFHNSIDYQHVRVHHGRLIPILQHAHTAMSPFGVMHFPAKLYESDFSQSRKKHLFIHEMTHVWQYHLGLKLWLDGGILACKGGYGKGLPAYRYDHYLTKRTLLSEFNMEQQADIIADYFILGLHKNNAALRQILALFIENPNNKALLPTHTAFK